MAFQSSTTVIAEVHSGTDARRQTTLRSTTSVDYNGPSSGTTPAAPDSRRQQRYNATSLFRQIFLPKGYPGSVSRDYATYQRWDTMQAFFSMINTVIATHAMLKAAGVGDHSRSALASALAWVLKDGAGMIANIIFTWLSCRSFDSNMKQWRIAADVFFNLTILIDIMSSVFSTPSTYFIFSACSSIVRAMVFVAGGATRVAVRQHQARANNLADVMAKSGSQDTAVNLAALLTGSLFVSLTHDNPIAICALFFVTAILHIMGNWFAVKSLRLETFNVGRLAIAVQRYLQCGKETAPTLAEVNDAEPISQYLFPSRLIMPLLDRSIFLCCGADSTPTVYIGVSVQSALSRKSKTDSETQLQRALENYADMPYVILMPSDHNDAVVRPSTARANGSVVSNNKSVRRSVGIYVFLKQNAIDADVFRGVFGALALYYDNDKTPGIACGNDELDAMFRDFCEKVAKKNWNVTSHYLSADEWRIVGSPLIASGSNGEAAIAARDRYINGVIDMHDSPREKKTI